MRQKVPNGIGYMNSGSEAAQAWANSRCGPGEFITGCTGAYTGMVWWRDAPYWFWAGTFTYTYKATGNTYTQDIGGPTTIACPDGWNVELSPSSWPARCYRNDPPLPPCEECDKRKAARAGNPILVNGGVKIQSEVDYENPSGSLRLVRTYRSDEGIWRHNYQIFGIDFNHIVYSTAPEFACFTGRAPGATSDSCFNGWQCVS